MRKILPLVLTIATVISFIVFAGYSPAKATASAFKPHYHLYVDMSKHASITEDEGVETLLPDCTPVPANLGCVSQSLGTVDFLVEFFNAVPNDRYDFQSDLFDRCASVTLSPMISPEPDGDSVPDDFMTNFHGDATIAVHALDCVPMNTGINAGSSDSKYYIDLVGDGTITGLSDGTSYQVRFSIVE